MYNVYFSYRSHQPGRQVDHRRKVNWARNRTPQLYPRTQRRKVYEKLMPRESRKSTKLTSSSPNILTIVSVIYLRGNVRVV